MQAVIDNKDLQIWADYLVDYSLGGVTKDDVVMIKGDVVMLIGEENYECSTGDVVFLSSMVPHSLNNTGEGETMYFAFQFWQ